ncbi:Protein of unknown function DUF461 [gamma proteobacterium HdN1]|nr:Protein of unknown function DUF461 [gamma proteobacterium HdN1]
MKPLFSGFFALIVVAILTGCVTVPANRKPDLPPASVVVKTDGWVRWVPATSRNSAVYFTVENPSLADDILIGASTPRARSTELHNTLDTGFAKTMQRVDGILIGGATRFDFSPDGYHVMLMDLNTPLKEGETIPLTLEFKRSGAIQVSFPVMMIYGGDQD